MSHQIIQTQDITDAAITAAKLGSKVVSAPAIADTTITAAQIASATITAAQIASATITGSLIASSTITGSNLANKTVASGNIADGAILAAQMGAGTAIAYYRMAIATLSVTNADTTASINLVNEGTVGLDASVFTNGGFLSGLTVIAIPFLCNTSISGITAGANGTTDAYVSTTNPPPTTSAGRGMTGSSSSTWYCRVRAQGSGMSFSATGIFIFLSFANT